MNRCFNCKCTQQVVFTHNICIWNNNNEGGSHEMRASEQGILELEGKVWGEMMQIQYACMKFSKIIIIFLKSQ